MIDLTPYDTGERPYAGEYDRLRHAVEVMAETLTTEPDEIEDLASRMTCEELESFILVLHVAGHDEVHDAWLNGHLANDSPARALKSHGIDK